MLEKNFTRVPNAFIRTQKYLSDKAVKVMNYICSCINSEDAKNGDERAFPSLVTIAENVGFSQPTVSRMIRELEAFNLLTKERNFNKSNDYRLADGLSEEEMKEVYNHITNKKKSEIARVVQRDTNNHTTYHENQSSVLLLTNNTKEQDEENNTNFNETKSQTSEVANAPSLSLEEEGIPIKEKDLFGSSLDNSLETAGTANNEEESNYSLEEFLKSLNLNFDEVFSESAVAPSVATSSHQDTNPQNVASSEADSSSESTEEKYQKLLSRLVEKKKLSQQNELEQAHLAWKFGNYPERLFLGEMNKPRYHF